MKRLNQSPAFLYSRPEMKRQVFLGGACGGTAWRRDVAIPSLEAAGVTYFDPQLAPGQWTEAYERSEMDAKDAADVLVFVVNGETRGVASVAEVAYYLAAGRALALTITDLHEGAAVDGRPLERAERDDLNRGRIFVRTMARERGVPVFDAVGPAIEHAIRLVRAAGDRLTRSDVAAVLGELEFRDTRFEVEEVADGFLLRLHAVGACAESGETRSLDGRRWHLDRSATRADVVRTAFKAALTWQEHETREAFRYRGVPVFGPHQDVEALAGLADAVGAPDPETLPPPLRLAEDE